MTVRFKRLITETSAGLLSFLLASIVYSVDLPKPESLHGEDFRSEIRYPDGELVREPYVREASQSGRNRGYTDIEKPTYFRHQADPAAANGVGLVICPGGGYRDVWLDREGHDLAIWLKQFGITSLVLKYRTNGKGEIDGRKYAWPEYMRSVTDDARQAVRVLRRRANEFKVDREKIGICGFSAGGNLAMHTFASSLHESPEEIVSGSPNFAGLFYPWFRSDDSKRIFGEFHSLSDLDLFIMNAADDNVTPTDRCLDFYQLLYAKGARPELHIVNKGGHGFDLGDGRGESAALWKRSFVAWLEDRGLATKATWQSRAPIGLTNDKIVADILPDHSIQFDPTKGGLVPRVRFKFDRPVTLCRVKMELLPNKETPRVAWKEGTEQAAPYIYDVNPAWRSAAGKWTAIDFSTCVYPPNPDYTDGKSTPHEIIDYIETGLRVPRPLPGEESVEFLMDLRKPLPLAPGDEFQLQLDSGHGGDKHSDGIGRVRFSFHVE